MNKGFTLFETLVALTLVSIISVIAYPSYNSYKARALQKEGFYLLNTYFITATAARAEHGFYPGDFVQTGFRPVGPLNYRLRSEVNSSGNNTGIAIDDNGCITTNPVRDCNCSGVCPGFRAWKEKSEGVPGASLGPYFPFLGSCPARYVHDSSFRVMVSGVINLHAASTDSYAIDDRKNIEMCLDGLK